MADPTDSSVFVDPETGFLKVGKEDTREDWEKVADGDLEWSSADPDGWQFVGLTLKSRFEFSSTGVFRSRVNKFAQDFAIENERLPIESELTVNTGLLSHYLTILKIGYPTALPPRFIFDGRLFENDPFLGPQEQRIDVPPALEDIEGAEKDFLLRFFTKAPSFTKEQIQARLTPQPPPPSPGRGVARRTARVFDRAQLIEASTDRWKQLMLEDPNEDTIGSLVDSYVARGNAFWMKEGGNLDFDTFVVNEIRKDERYKILYGKKDAHLTEEEWMGRYRGTVEQFGLGARATLRETEAGLTSGVGVAGFTERVARTREARLANSGTFSQRVASSLSASGLGGS